MQINKIRNNYTSQNNPQFGGSNNDDTIKGVLLKRYIQNRAVAQDEDIAAFSNSLLVPQSVSQIDSKIDEKEAFDYKKVLKPVLITTGLAAGAFLGASAIISKYSNKLATEKGLVKPYDIATNVNILEEPHFAFYRALIKPSKKNIFGFMGVCLFSGLTLTAKNFVDGVSEVWTKKQEFDAKHDYMKSMIEIDRDTFSGKLNVVNTMLKDTSDYFNKYFTKKTNNQFGSFINFKGKTEENADKTQDKNENKEKFKKIAMLTGTAASIAAVGFCIYKNYSKAMNHFEEYTAKSEHAKILQDIGFAKEKFASGKEEEAIDELKDILSGTNVEYSAIDETLKDIKIPDEVMQKIKDSVGKRRIYSKPPIALSGMNGINYYCYINEERGHLYNWILHPENPFNKYLFLGFSIISSLGYVAKKAAEAVKNAVVNKENKKSEINLNKKLVAVEIENFKVKKESAINPLVENFKIQAKNGKTEKELKEMAQNILTEIKTGPPYVYS